MMDRVAKFLESTGAQKINTKFYLLTNITKLLLLTYLWLQIKNNCIVL